MLSAIESVLSVLLMIALGFVIAKRNWFDGKSSALVSRLVVSVALPAYMIANLMGGYDRARLISMLPGLPVPFAVMSACYAVGAGIAAVARLPRGSRGTFASMFALSNTIFIGLPVNLMLFGDESLPHVLLYYIANTSLFWTIGVYGIARDGSVIAGAPRPALVSASSLKRILSPPLIAFLAAVGMILLGMRLPRAIMDASKTLGAMTTPLSMLFIGIVVARVEWRTLRLERGLVLVLAGRFLVSPALLVLAARWADLPLLMKQVFLIQASMPAMTQTPILAEAYGADAEFAGLATSLSTVLSLATIPVFMALAGSAF
jgi:predicted permease